MTEILKILGVGFVTAISAILLRATKPELSFAVTLTGVVVILLFLLDAMRGTMGIFQKITELTGMENGLIRVLVKIVGVGYLTEFGVGILKDFGSNSVADKVAVGGKLVILTMSLPILEGLLAMIKGFLQLV